MGRECPLCARSGHSCSEPECRAESLGQLAATSPFCATDCRRWWFQERIEPLPDDGIALTRSTLQTRAIQYLDPPATVADETGILHRLCSQRHRFSIGAQYVCEKLVGVCQKFAFCPVMHHEKPPAHPLFRRMHGIACDCLLDLGQQRLGITHEEIAHMLAVAEFCLQQFNRAARHVAFQLHDTAIEGHPAVHRGEQTKRAFATNVCSFNGRPVFQDGQ